MKKSSLFISALLTTFILAIVAAVIAGVRTPLVNNTQTVNTQPTALAQPAQTITPQQAATIASQFLGRNDLYSVTSTRLGNATVFAVTFSSGDIVYVSPAGQVVSMVAAPVSASPNTTFRIQPPAGEHEGSGDDD